MASSCLPYEKLIVGWRQQQRNFGGILDYRFVILGKQNNYDAGEKIVLGEFGSKAYNTPFTKTLNRLTLGAPTTCSFSLIHASIFLYEINGGLMFLTVIGSAFSFLLRPHINRYSLEMNIKATVLERPLSSLRATMRFPPNPLRYSE